MRQQSVVEEDPVDGSGDGVLGGSAIGAWAVVAGHWRRGLGLAMAGATAAVVALVTALLLGGGRPQAAPEGLPDAGPVTGWALPMAKVAFDVAAIGTIGCLLVAAVLVGGLGRFDLPDGRLSPLALRATRTASWWAAGWCAATVSVLVLSLSDIFGVPIGRILSLQMLTSLPWTVPLSRLLMVTVVACLALVGLARRTVTTRGAGTLLVLAVAALVPVLFTGHAATTADHDLATSSLVVHVVAVALWVGGLLALLVCVRADEHVLATAVPRFSTLALGCFVVVGFSGALNAFLRLGPTVSTWVSPYGALLAAKATGLVLLGWMGREHRRRSIPGVLAGRPRAFLRLAGGEVVIMAAVIGLAVALGRTPYPAAAGADAVPAHGSGHDTLPFEVLPWSPATVLTQWRPDALVLTAVGLAVAAYVVGVRHLARRGQRWPRRRTTSAMVGLATAVLALCGGLASYSTALFSVQVAQFLVLATVVPLLLTLGMPLALLREVREVRSDRDSDPLSPGPPLLAGKVAGALSNPVNGLLLLVAVLVGLYTTPLFEMSLRYFTLHLLGNVLALAGGLAFFWSVIGVDELPERRAVTVRALCLCAFLLLLTGFGAVLVAGGGLYGGRWFTDLGLTSADPVVDQRRGGAVVWAFALGLAPVTLLVLRAQLRRAVIGTVSLRRRDIPPRVRVAVAMALTALAIVGLRAEVAEPVRVASGSMAPTLEQGDVVVVDKLDREPARGDLVTFRSPQDGERAVKRVVGVGGDVVEIRDAILYVNNVEVKEPYVDHESIDALYYGPVTVVRGTVLVMGDDRANSIDSRIYGDVSLRDVSGTVVARIWPPGAFTPRDRGPGPVPAGLGRP